MLVFSSVSLLLLSLFPVKLARSIQAGAERDGIARTGHVRATRKDGPNGPCLARSGSRWGRTLSRAVRHFGSSTFRFGRIADRRKRQVEHAPEVFLGEPEQCPQGTDLSHGRS